LDEGGCAVSNADNGDFDFTHADHHILCV